MFEEGSVLLARAVNVVGSLEVLKNYTKGKKVPGAVWAILGLMFSVVYSLPFIPAWVSDAALVYNTATLFYDYILQSVKKKFLKSDGEKETHE